MKTNNNSILLPLQEDKVIAKSIYTQRIRTFLLTILISFIFICISLLIYRFLLVNEYKLSLSHESLFIISLGAIIAFYLITTLLTFNKNIQSYKKLLSENTRLSRQLVDFKRFDLIKDLVKILLPVCIVLLESVLKDILSFDNSILFVFLIPVIFFLYLTTINSDGSNFIRDIFNKFLENLIKMLDGLLKQINIKLPSIKTDKKTAHNKV